MLNLYFYTCHIQIEAPNEIYKRLQRDFSYFTIQNKENTRSVFIEVKQHPTEKNKTGLYLFNHFNGKIYGWGDTRHVIYSDTTVFFDAKKNTSKIISMDLELLYHYTYYMIIAKVGEFLDRDCLHRFHSLAVCINGINCLFSMPVCGGKTTLGLAMMRRNNIRLFSEDTPLIDHKGHVWPFPLRLSLRPRHNVDILKKFQRIKKDPIFGTKILVDLSFYNSEQIMTNSQAPQFIFWGIKTTKSKPQVKRINSICALCKLSFYIIVGKDCPQRSEIFLRLSLRGLWMILEIFFKRSLAAINLWRKTKSYYFYMTTDIEKNVSFITEFTNKKN